MKHYKFYFISRLLSYFLFSVILTIIIVIPIFKLNNSNVIDIIKDKRFIDALVFGTETATIATILSAIFGIPIGFFLARNKSLFSKIIDSVFEIPVIIPPLIIGVLLLMFFNITVVNFIFTFKGAIIAQFIISFPYTLKASQNAFELVPAIYEQIAMTLGATPFKSFIDTTFKLSIRGILSGIILSWIRSFGEFGATLLVGGAISGKTENMPVYIYMTMTQGNYEKGIWASLIIILLGLIIIFFLKELLKSNNQKHKHT